MYIHTYVYVYIITCVNLCITCPCVYMFCDLSNALFDSPAALSRPEAVARAQSCMHTFPEHMVDLLWLNGLTHKLMYLDMGVETLDLNLCELNLRELNRTSTPNLPTSTKIIPAKTG